MEGMKLNLVGGSLSGTRLGSEQRSELRGNKAQGALAGLQQAVVLGA